MPAKKKRTESQRAADRAYESKRKGQPRLPGSYLTDAENNLLCELAKIYGSKKEAIFKGLELLKKNKK